MKVQGDFLGPPRSTDKTTLIIKVSNGENTCLVPIFVLSVQYTWDRYCSICSAIKCPLETADNFL